MDREFGTVRFEMMLISLSVSLDESSCKCGVIGTHQLKSLQSL